MANKRNNRLAKQGKLNKSDKKKKQKRARLVELNERAANQRAVELKNETLSDSELETEDKDQLSDEDVSFFQNVKNAQVFAKINLGTE